MEFHDPYLVVHLTHDDAVTALRTQEGPGETLERAACHYHLVPRLRGDELECAVGEADLDAPVNRDRG